ncbi:MAG: hypothetical protein GOV15_01165, partial [Candidatus Diapherotrites archaeon]|nr:hypothetical protein [Candidatus Diapherotrites archaeon]
MLKKVLLVVVLSLFCFGAKAQGPASQPAKVVVTAKKEVAPVVVVKDPKVIVVAEAKVAKDKVVAENKEGDKAETVKPKVEEQPVNWWRLILGEGIKVLGAIVLLMLTILIGVLARKWKFEGRTNTVISI